MQLTQYTDYSLRVLIYLGVHPDELATITEISDRYQISRNHLVKVVHELGKLGYIETIRGKGGGMRLAVSPEELTIGEIVRNMENNLNIVECFGNESSCAITPNCRLRGILRDALKSFISVLDQYTLKDILVNQKKLQGLLGTA